MSVRSASQPRQPDDAGESQREIAELRRTIDAMREQLDLQRLGEADRLAQAVRSRDDEVRQLKAMVQAMRDELDLAHARHRDDMDATARRHQGEADELRRTIAAMRDQLEGRP